MSEILGDIALNCGRNRGGILSITAIPCEGITFTVTDGLATVGVQTKVARTIALDINSGKASSTREGDRATFSSVYKEQVEFTVKSDELLDLRTISTLTGGLHTYIVSYANGKNKIYGAGGQLNAAGEIVPIGMLANDVSDSGTEGTDMNGVIVTATSESTNIPPHISKTDLDTIKAFTVSP